MKWLVHDKKGHFFGGLCHGYILWVDVAKATEFATIEDALDALEGLDEETQDKLFLIRKQTKEVALGAQ